MTKEEEIQVLMVEFRLNPDLVVHHIASYENWCCAKNGTYDFYCTRYPGHEWLHLATYCDGDRFKRCPCDPWK